MTSGAPEQAGVPADPAGAVPSPCVSVCRMDQRIADTPGALCSGCLRTIEEIIAWSHASDADKLLVWKKIGERRLALPLEDR